MASAWTEECVRLIDDIPDLSPEARERLMVTTGLVEERFVREGPSTYRHPECGDTLMTMFANEKGIAYGGQCKAPVCVDERGRRCAEARVAPEPRRRATSGPRPYEPPHDPDDTPDDGIPF